MNSKKPSSPLSDIQDFLNLESASGLILVITMCLALLVANSSYEGLYRASLDADIGIGFHLSVLHLVNDGLMAVFFLLVALEIKREFVAGELSQPGQLTLPAVAAVGGMAVPSLVYVAFAWHGGEAMHGWAIPSATDIAFSLGVLALLGSRVPVSLKIFLTALAIIDDLGAILVIALFYSGGLSWAYLAGSAVVVALLYGLNRAGVRTLWAYLPLGLALWALMMPSGLHATIAGVLLGLCIPLKDGHTDLEHWLHPWVAFGVLPVFAFANSGLALDGVSWDILRDPIFLGVALGLFVGKQVGVFGGSALVIKAGLASLPQGACWRSLYGVSVLTGIGFTMSLFIGNLAYPDGDAVAVTRLAVIVGSLASALAGTAILLTAPRKAVSELV